MEFQGVFKPNPRGFGFINTGTHNIYVHPRIARRFFYFDTVKGAAEQNEEGKWSCVEAQLLESGLRRVAGTIEKDAQSAFWLVPEVAALPKFPIYCRNSVQIGSGDKVVATALQTPQGWAMEVEQVIGDCNSDFWESLLSVALYQIPTRQWNEPVSPLPAIGYADKTDIAFCTIDDESTQDIDDAIHVQEYKDGWRLMVAIADASRYVRQGSDLDAYARERATTVYFVQNVLPMLPRSVSHSAGSLQPNSLREALVCTVDVHSDGTIASASLERAVIKSRARLTYEQVTAFVQGHESAVACEMHASIKQLYALYEALLQRRLSRGSQPIRSGDYNFQLDEHGRPASIYFKAWHVAYGMVEEAMLCANTAVAGWLLQRGVPCLYRHHKGPEALAWQNARPYLEYLGFVDIPLEPTPMFLSQLTEVAAEKGEELGVTNVIRAAMRAASYDVTLPSHFGLAYEHYTHFSSPLRRYADLTVHRVIHRVLANEPLYTEQEIKKIALECSLADARAKKATREEAKRLKVQYASNFIGAEVNMQLTGGNASGWFLRSEEPPIETFFTHGESNNKWSWNSTTQRAVHAELGEVRLGTVLVCTVQSVDLDKLRVQVSPHIICLTKIQNNTRGD